MAHDHTPPDGHLPPDGAPVERAPAAHDDQRPDTADRLAALDDRLGGHFVDEPTANDADGHPPEGLDAILLLRQVAAEARNAAPLDGGPTPRRIGRFAILREVGRGGFARVYEAIDTRLTRRVALKVARPETLLTPGMRRRFVREAELAARLDHPHVVAIHDAGEADGQAYIAEEFCAGGSLAEWLERHRSPLPPRAAARVVQSLAGAMAHSHGFCVLHRDIKPGNVLLVPAADGPLESDRGRCAVKLGDFGLGKLVDGVRPTAVADLTSANVRIGTPAWMAPEQVDARLGTVGPATDIHGLGLILDRLLTGRAQFAGPDDAATLRMVLTTDPIAPDRIVGAVPADLAAVTLKCLARNPLERYPTVADLAGDLSRFLAGLPTNARPLSPVARGLRFVGRHRLVAAAVAVALATTLAALGAGAVQMQQQRALAARGAEIRSHQAAATLRRGFESWRAGDVPGALAQIDTCRSLDPSLADSLAARWLRTRVRGEDAILLTRSDPHPEGTLGDQSPRDLYTMAVSADGSMIAAAGAEGVLRCIRLDGDGMPTGTPLAVAVEGEITDIAFAPDGTAIATAGVEGMLRVFDTASGELRRQWRFADGTLFAVDWSKDGRRLACGGQGGIVRLLDADGAAEPLGVFTLFDRSRPGVPADAAIEALAFVAGDRVAASCGKLIAIHDPLGRDDGCLLDVPDGTVSHLSASPDGTRMITGGTDRTPRVWDVVTGKLVATLPVHPSWVAGCALNDGGIAATSCRDGVVRLFDIARNGTLSTFVGHEDRVWDVAILPGGDVVSAGRDGTVRRWRPRRSPEFTSWSERHVAWSGGISHAIPLVPDASADHLLVVARVPDALGLVDARGRWSSAPERSRVRNDILIDDRASRFAATDDDYTIFVQSLPGRGDPVIHRAPPAIANGKPAWSGTAGLVIATRRGLIAHWDGSGATFDVIDQIDARPDAVAVTMAKAPRAVVVADKLVRVYALTADGGPVPGSGRTVVVLPEQLGRGIAVAWAPDGGSFVIGTNEGTLERFDASTGLSLGVFARHSGPIRAVAWAPDGRTLVSADATRVRFSDDRTTTVFDEFRPGWVIESMHLGVVGGTVHSIVVAGNVEGDGGPEGPGRIAVAVVR